MSPFAIPTNNLAVSRRTNNRRMIDYMYHCSYNTTDYNQVQTQ